MILFLWFLVMGLGLGLGQNNLPSQRIDPFARTVWLDPPVTVADDRALRLDVQTSSILLRAQISKLVVCSAVDRSIVAYDENAPQATGCDTPGFLSTQVFPLLTEEDPATRDHRTPPDIYRVRQRARSLFIKRRLLDPHSPTVWLQATLEVRAICSGIVCTHLSLCLGPKGAGRTWTLGGTRQQGGHGSVPNPGTSASHWTNTATLARE
jgi:hypothetical protein